MSSEATTEIVADDHDSHGGGHGHGAHPKPKYDDVNIPVVVLLGVLSAILTFVAIAFVQGLYFSWQESMVQADWNNRRLTPQEQTIADQKQIRDGFYQTKDGKVFISVDAAAQKMIGKPSQGNASNAKQPEKAGQPEATKKSDPKVVPPGPEPKSEEAKKDPVPVKDESAEKKNPEAKPPVTKGAEKTGDK